MGGTAVELLLLKHDEDAIQLVPLVLIGAGSRGARVACGPARTASAWFVRVAMVAFLAAGLAGVYFHYRANVEFQLETDPSLAGAAAPLEGAGRQSAARPGPRRHDPVRSPRTGVHLSDKER